MKYIEYTEKQVKISKRSNDRIEKDFIDFCKTFKNKEEKIENRTDETGITIGRTDYCWETKTKTWNKIVKVYPPPPKYLYFIAYGNFCYSDKNINFILVKCPFKTKWKSVVSAVDKFIKANFDFDEELYWNVDTYDGIEKTWESKKSKVPSIRCYFKNGKMVKRRKSKDKK